jgi:hypothetical protein
MPEPSASEVNQLLLISRRTVVRELNVSSPQAGYLYIINEGLELTGSPPDSS